MTDEVLVEILSKCIENKIDAEEVDHICNSLARMYERLNHVANVKQSREKK